MVGGAGVNVGGKKTGARVGTSVGRWVAILVGSAVGDGSTAVVVTRVSTVAVAVGLLAIIWDVL